MRGPTSKAGDGGERKGKRGQGRRRKGRGGELYNHYRIWKKIQ